VVGPENRFPAVELEDKGRSGKAAVEIDYSPKRSSAIKKSSSKAEALSLPNSEISASSAIKKYARLVCGGADVVALRATERLQQLAVTVEFVQHAANHAAIDRANDWVRFGELAKGAVAAHQ
jgi:hypothetical protein